MGTNQKYMPDTRTQPVACDDLTFRYDMAGPNIIKKLSLHLEPGSRCLLVGSNGAGKTTLLNVLGGKHMHEESAVKVLGQPAFSDTHPGVTVLSGAWSRTVACASNAVPYQNDVSVEQMLATRDGEADPERLAHLVKILDVNLKWRMHVVSDGQRRRVQILMALIKPFNVLLLDEVTVDLDVLARARLLEYLVHECETRGATILYATHIFDGLDGWATHLAHITDGSVKRFAAFKDMTQLEELAARGSACPLLEVVEGWIRVERDEERELREEMKVLKAAQEKDLKLSEKTSKYDPFGKNRMYNYW